MLQNKHLSEWIANMEHLCQPDDVVICNGGREEYDAMWDKLLRAGTAKKLNEEIRPNSYLVRSDPADVARVEQRKSTPKVEALILYCPPIHCCG